MTLTLSDIEIVQHRGIEEWKHLVQLVKKHENWIIAVEDYDTWIRSFGEQNFNLIIAFDKATKTRILGGIVVAFLNADGPKEDGLVTVGMFFVLPECRAIGLGSKLFEIGLSDPRSVGINKGLNAVAVMSEKYASKNEFSQYTESAVAVVEIGIENLKFKNINETTFHITTSTIDNLDELVQYDLKQTNGIPRRGYLETMVTSTNSLFLTAFNGDKIVGCGRVRGAVGGNLAVGPLYADTPDIAEALFSYLIKDFDNLSNTYTTVNFYALFNNVAFWKLISKLTDGNYKIHGPLFTQFTINASQINVKTIYSITDHVISVY